MEELSGMSMFVRRTKEAKLRPMTAQDIEEVREVGQIAWSDLAMHDIGRKFRYPKRSERIIEAYMATDPEACIVAEIDGKLVGSAFCHAWGRVGWTGPLEVLPSYQDHGIGRQLLRACEARLHARGCTVIGLETMCHLPKNLHFYLTSGYRLEQTTVILEKILRPEPGGPDGIREVTADDIGTGLAFIGDLSRKVNEDLDYTPEVESILRQRLGSVFVLDGPEGPSGCALLHTYQRGEEAPFSSVKALLVDPMAPEPLTVLDRLLSRCEAASLEQGKSRLLTRFVVNDLRAYDRMLARAYTLKGANVRMIKAGHYVERGTCNITSWAG